MKKIMFVIGMLALVISCKMPNDYSDTDASNQIQIENPSSEITDDEENEPSNPIEDEEESEIIDDSEDIKDEEKDWCEIKEDTDLFSLTYFIHFDGQEVLITSLRKYLDNNSNFHHLGILEDIPLSSNSHVLYTFDLWITKSENKLKVLKHNGGNPTLKKVYLKNGNEVHIVF